MNSWGLFAVIAMGFGSTISCTRGGEKSSLETTLEAMLGSLEGDNGVQLANAEAELGKAYEALPKNAVGQLAPQAVRHIVYSYFVRKHGWHIQGLEPHGMRRASSKSLHDVKIIQERAPLLKKALLGMRVTERGASLEEVVAYVTLLERLIFHESMPILLASYQLNNFSAGEEVTNAGLRRILSSYLQIMNEGVVPKNASDHQNGLKLVKMEQSSRWDKITEFVNDVVQSVAYEEKDHRNPFVQRNHSFVDSWRVAEILMRGYGKWQDAECVGMKKELVEMSRKNSGRVPLKTFYAKRKDAIYEFAESPEYLEQIGALDTMSGSPKIILANYIIGPSNCISNFPHYAVCCLNECLDIMHKVESKIRAPIGNPEQILAIVSGMSSTTEVGPRRLSQALQDKLLSIASVHEGNVPVHGRLFAQWLHYVFPNDCPYPSIVQNAAALMPSRWAQEAALAKPGEIKQYIKENTGKDALESRYASEEPPMLQWTDHEVLPLQGDKTFVMPPPRQTSTSSPPDDNGWYVLEVIVVAVVFLVGLWYSSQLTSLWKRVVRSCQEASNSIDKEMSKDKKMNREVGSFVEKEMATETNRKPKHTEKAVRKGSDETEKAVRKGSDPSSTASGDAQRKGSDPSSTASGDAQPRKKQPQKACKAAPQPDGHSSDIIQAEPLMGTAATSLRHSSDITKVTKEEATETFQTKPRKPCKVTNAQKGRSPDKVSVEMDMGTLAANAYTLQTPKPEPAALAAPLLAPTPTPVVVPVPAPSPPMTPPGLKPAPEPPLTPPGLLPIPPPPLSPGQPTSFDPELRVTAVKPIFPALPQPARVVQKTMLDDQGQRIADDLAKLMDPESSDEENSTAPPTDNRGRSSSSEADAYLAPPGLPPPPPPLPPGLAPPPGLGNAEDTFEVVRNTKIANVASLKEKKAVQQTALASLLDQAAVLQQEIRALDETLDAEVRWLEGTAPAHYGKGFLPMMSQSMFDEPRWN